MADNIDFANELNSQMQDLVGSGQDFNKILKNSNKILLDLNTVADHFAQTWDDLPNSISSGKDLLSAVTKDAKLFAKIQQESLNISKQMADDTFQDMHDSLLKQYEIKRKTISEEMKSVVQQEYSADLMERMIDLSKERNQLDKDLHSNIISLGKDRDKTEQLLSKHLDNQLNNLKAQSEEIKSINTNAVALVDALGDKIRNPAKTIDSMFLAFGDLPNKLSEIKKKTGSWGGALKEVVGNSSIVRFAKIFGPAGVLVAGFGVLAGVAAIVWKSFKQWWDFLDKKVMPAQAEFNKQLGATSEGAAQFKKQMISTGVQFELLGYSFEEGASKVREFGVAMKTALIDEEVRKAGVELQAILGLTGDEAGRLVLQFQKETGGIKELNETLSAGRQAAENMGLAVNVVLKDIASSPEVFARFGVANRIEFGLATAKAQDYGLSIKEVTDAFGKQMDTFEGTATASAKLNAVFGTNINSMKLMMETNPVKRMEMLREELLKQGKSWEDLNVFEQNVITSTLGLSKEKVKLMLASEEERKKAEAARKAREKEIKINENWNKGIGTIKKTVLALQPLIDKLMRAFGEFAGKLLFNIDVGKDFMKTGGGIEKILTTITSGINMATERLGPAGLTGVLADVPSFMDNAGTSLENLGNLAKTTTETINALANAFDWITQPFDTDKAETFIKDMEHAVRMGSDAMKAQSEHLDKMDEDVRNLVLSRIKRKDPAIRKMFETGMSHGGIGDIDKLKKATDNILRLQSKEKEITLELEKTKNVERKKELQGLLELIRYQTSDLISLTTKQLGEFRENTDKIYQESTEKQFNVFETMLRNMESNAQTRKVNDYSALIKPSGEVIEFSPQDTVGISASKTPASTGSSSDEVRELKAMVTALVKELRETRTIQANLHLDGRKITESQVKLARYG